MRWCFVFFFAFSACVRTPPPDTFEADHTSAHVGVELAQAASVDVAVAVAFTTEELGELALDARTPAPADVSLTLLDDEGTPLDTAASFHRPLAPCDDDPCTARFTLRIARLDGNESPVVVDVEAVAQVQGEGVVRLLALSQEEDAAAEEGAAP